MKQNNLLLQTFSALISPDTLYPFMRIYVKANDIYYCTNKDKTSNSNVNNRINSPETSSSIPP